MPTSAPIDAPGISPPPEDPAVTNSPSAKLDFLVRPRGEAWEIAVGPEGACFLFETRAEAVRRAKATAQTHWQDKQEASRVSVQDHRGRLRTLVRYGP